MKKNTRTISGVTPIAVMSKPSGCPGNCVYCPKFEDVPRSYTPHSPAVMRAATRGYDAAEQVKLRLRILQDMGHPTDKVELIVMGGTFLSTPIDYQNEFIKACFDALNGTAAESLNSAQQINESASYRAVGLCIETRPDVCGREEIERMVSWGVTRVELGVQTIDDSIYQTIRRGHNIEAVVESTKMLRQAGLKVHYHWMPGLPGSTPEHDLAMTEELFKNPKFRPDGLKIYPTMVVEGTELEDWYRDGKYKPYSNADMTNLLARIKSTVPPYVRISRVLRDIPAEYITGGLKNSLRDNVQEQLKYAGLSCQCIRCREYGHRARRKLDIGKPFLKRREYEASGGTEIFLSFEDDYGTLFGLLRLRMQHGGPKVLSNGENKLALIRELHVFGSELLIGTQGDENSVQHKGLGRGLLKEAERIVFREYHLSRVGVLSGVGARAYYRSLGFKMVSGYMVKELTGRILN